MRVTKCLELTRAVAAAGLFALTLSSPDAVATDSAKATHIEQRLSQAHLTVAGRQVETADLRDAYRGRDYAPFWLAADAGMARARALHAVLVEAAREGLNAADYTIAGFDGLLAAADEPDAADLDILLSALLVRYAADLRHGRLAPRWLDPELFSQPRTVDAAAILTRAAASKDLAQHLSRLAPANAPYRRLRRALADYQRIADSGGWLPLDSGPTLKPGMSGPAVLALRQRLLTEGWTTDERRDGGADQFDAGLVLALQEFQRHRLLETDGVVGPKTREALNVPVEERMRQIMINMERWRWMPDDLGQFYVMVNMAAYELEVIDSGSIALAMRVVVGRPYRRTPVFSDRIRYLEFNPTWTVPVKIASKDLVPKQIADPGYLQRNGFRMFDGWSGGAQEIDIGAVDWPQYKGRRLPYRLLQMPGKTNALGRVKFMFPNKYDVYLHDTASPELFARTLRNFSSGCIRVEKPRDLAVLLLRDTPGWDQQAVDRALASEATKVVNLAEPVPVYLTYRTVWLGDGGTPRFAPDVYERDRQLYDALFK